MQVHEMIRDQYPEYYSIERYPAAQTVCIRKTKDEWGVFGNFYRTPIVVNGVTFDCTERLFHIMKFKPDATEGIREQMDVSAGQRIKMHMRSISRNHPEWLHDHWPTMVVDAMKYCLTLKYEQCDLFRKELQRSRGMFIVEDETSRKRGRNADTWGAVLQGEEYVGPNLLGRLLMELRDNGKLEYTLPADALDFTNVLNQIDMATFYHGSPFLFDKFDLSQAGEGTGIKFGFGVYLTESETSAVHYSQPRNMPPMEHHYLYTVEIPELTEDNHLVSAKPVPASIVARVEAKLGRSVPEEKTLKGKEFRKWIGMTLTGGKKPGFAEEKAAAQFLDEIGVICNVWPQAQNKPDGLRNCAVFNADRVHILKVQHIDNL